MLAEKEQLHHFSSRQRKPSGRKSFPENVPHSRPLERTGELTQAGGDVYSPAGRTTLSFCVVTDEMDMSPVSPGEADRRSLRRLPW